MKLLVEIPDYRYRAIKKIDVTQKPYTICEILTKEAYEDLCMGASKGAEHE